MLKRTANKAKICFSCHTLVSANVKVCHNCKQINPTLWGYEQSLRQRGPDFGFVQFVIKVCAVLYVLSLLIDIGGIRHGDGQDLMSPSTASTLILGSSGAHPIFYAGRWWTIFTAGWLHNGLIHVVFNLFWIYHLGPWVAKLYGAGRLVVIYVTSSAVGAALSSLIAYYFPHLPAPWQGAQLTVGASGAVLGLLGAMVSHGQRTRNGDLTYRAGIYGIFLILIGLLSGRNIDNWGHIGGFIGGYLITQIPGFNSCQPQRLWHFKLAIASLGIIIFSFILSIGHFFFRFNP